jgi:hypothetical protein
MSQNDWLVRLPVFQGPLDLLLFLVRRAELDIHDIPIHTLTDEYLAYVRHLSRVDIDLAGEFLVMAATLVEIKSRSLAPAQVADEGDPSAPAAPGEDPRAELIRQLLAYQKFRTAAEVLEARRREFTERAPARVRPGATEETVEEEDFELDDLHLGDLYAAFEKRRHADLAPPGGPRRPSRPRRLASPGADERVRRPQPRRADRPLPRAARTRPPRPRAGAPGQPRRRDRCDAVRGSRSKRAAFLSARNLLRNLLALVLRGVRFRDDFSHGDTEARSPRLSSAGLAC